MSTCAVPDCNQPVFSRGWCGAHYRRWWSTGDVQADKPLQKRAPRRRPGQKPAICRAKNCDRDVTAHGFCWMHYGQARGKYGLASRQLGEPDGYGQWGVLDEDAEGLLCHECGGRYKSLGSHVSRGHGIPARDYKKRHGLPATRPLVTKAMSAEQSEKSRGRLGSAAWDRMAAKRDPVEAARARTEATFEAVSSAQRQRFSKKLEDMEPTE